jgi:drug/metabolite transporter (DMT)-like permease
MKDLKSVVSGSVAISLAAMLWGFDGVYLTPRLYNLDIGFVVFMVHAIPFILMQFFFYKSYSTLRTLNRAEYLSLAMVALFGGAIGTLAIVKALFLVEFKQLTIVVLLQKLQPVFAIILATIILKEKLKPNFILWASMAILAGYFLTFGLQWPDFHTDKNAILAAAYSLLAAFSFGSSTVFSKRALQRVSFQDATFFRYGFTSLIMLLFVLISGKLTEFNMVTTTNWIIFLVITLTTGSGAIFIFYYGLVRVKAIIATICELFFPISAIFFDYLLNGNRLNTVQWISAFIMIFAIINLNLPSKKGSTETV